MHFLFLENLSMNNLRRDLVQKNRELLTIAEMLVFHVEKIGYQGNFSHALLDGDRRFRRTVFQ